MLGGGYDTNFLSWTKQLSKYTQTVPILQEDGEDLSPVANVESMEPIPR